MSANGPHILGNFDEELDTLKDTLLTMGRMTRSQIEDSVKALIERKIDLSNNVIAEDETVDSMESDIDALGMAILLKYRPVATDLRLVMAALNISRSLERIADHAVNIAKRGKKIVKAGEFADAVMVEPHAAAADLLLADSLRAFTDGDVELALSLRDRNKQLGKDLRKLIKNLTARMEESSDDTATYLHLIFVCRSIARTGDLSVNIAEDAVFHELAENPKHGWDD